MAPSSSKSVSAKTSELLAKQPEPINDTPLARTLTRLVIKVRCNHYVRKVWKPPAGLLSFSKFCIKCYPVPNLAEAHALQFVARNTSIPVPKVYCAFIRKGRTYTVMRRIDGQTAAVGWFKRSEESKKRILDQLRGIAEELRAISPPKDFGVANVVGGPICDPRLQSLTSGPFATVRDFHKALTNGSSIESASYENCPADIVELMAFYQQPSLGEVVFTHGDLSSLNILVRGDEVVGIIDWETAGWFPPYWEYTCAWNVNFLNEFWQPEVDKFLTPLPYENRMEIIRRKYFGF